MEIKDELMQDKNNLAKKEFDMYQLYARTLDHILKKEEFIIDFLLYSSQLYKYPSETAIYLYGQNPNATFVADFDTWDKLEKLVKYGQKALKVMGINETFTQMKIKNYFDVSQTTGKDYHFPNWKITEAQFEKLISHYLVRNNKEITGNMQENKQQFALILNEKYEKAFENKKNYGKLASKSSELMVYHKLGQTIDQNDYQPYLSELVGQLDAIVVFQQIQLINKEVFTELDQIKKELEKGEVINDEYRNEIGRDNEQLSKQSTIGEIRPTSLDEPERKGSDGIRNQISRGNIDDLRSPEGRESMEVTPQIDGRDAGAESTSKYSGYLSEDKTRESTEITSGRDYFESNQLNDSNKESFATLAEGSFFIEKGWSVITEDEFKRVGESIYLLDGRGEFTSEKIHIRKFNEKIFYIKDSVLEEKLNNVTINGTWNLLGDHQELVEVNGNEFISPVDPKWENKEMEIIKTEEGFIFYRPFSWKEDEMLKKIGEEEVVTYWEWDKLRENEIIQKDGNYFALYDTNGECIQEAVQVKISNKNLSYKPILLDTVKYEVVENKLRLKEIKLDEKPLIFEGGHAVSAEGIRLYMLGTNRLTLCVENNVATIDRDSRIYNMKENEFSVIEEDSSKSFYYKVKNKEIFTNDVHELEKRLSNILEEDTKETRELIYHLNKKVETRPVVGGGTLLDRYIKDYESLQKIKKEFKNTKTKKEIEQPTVEEISLFDFEEDQEETIIVNDEVIQKSEIKILSEVPEPLEVEQKNKELEGYVFPENLSEIYGKKPLDRLTDNIKAIELLTVLETENRQATSDEKDILARYVGWGGLAEIFNDNSSKYQEEKERLKKLLTKEDYQNARESVLTAYYTDPKIIQEVYKKINAFGFTEGRILDPAMGTGNFYSAMPEEMKRKSELIGVEIDVLTGKIAQYLHTDTKVIQKGFEESNLRNNTFDVVVGNVPFSDYKIVDKSYKESYLIHDYFFKKSIDLLHEGGILAFITSTGTLDKKNASFRKEVSQKADFIGAVRLPNDAFKKIAGTEVATDIIFLKKNSNPNKERQSINWIDIYDEKVPDMYNEKDDNLHVSINQYFKDHNELVLGKFAIKNFRGKTLTVVSDGEELSGKLSKALEGIEGRYEQLSYELPKLELQEENEEEEDYRNFSYIVKHDQLYFYQDSNLELVTFSENKENRIKGMVDIRDQLLKVIDIQKTTSYDQGQFKNMLKELNQTYDQFVSKHGSINAVTNTRAFQSDDMLPLLMSIENKNKDGSYSKGDVFEKATIRPIEMIEKVDTASEALKLSMALKLNVDMDYIQEIYPKPLNEIIYELGDEIFINPEKYTGNKESDCWEVRDEYLTGDVKTKLETLLKDYNYDLFQTNKIALEQVIPTDLKPSEIDFKIGSTWIPLSYYKQFMIETFETPGYAINYKMVDINYTEFGDTWSIEGKNVDGDSFIASNKYGTKRANAYRLFEDSLNLRNTEVRDPEEYINGKGDRATRYVLNPEATMFARSKQEEIQERFNSWLFEDQERMDHVVSIYNEKFNRIVPRKYDGSNLIFNGMNQQFELRKHQKDVVARILYSGKALMAHEVGAGKTASMIASGMTMKDLGLIKKPLYIVPNHLTEQFGQELLRFYPTKKVLITTKKDFEMKNRKTFVSKIATGDYDAIIIGHSQFEKIPLSYDRQMEIIRNEIEQVKEVIRSAKQEEGKNWSVKQMVSFEKKLKLKWEKLRNQDRKDDLLTFEELGVDFLFVDEAHTYKNLQTFTKLQNVAGVNTSGSLRASDMHMKTNYMLEEYGDRGVVFATGTPISNSMSEMYTMQRYLQPSILDDMGIASFDAWASTFGQITSSLELTPEGSGYQMKTRFAKFHNLPELMNTFNLVADIQTADMLKLPVPEIKTGKAIMVVSEATEYQFEMMDKFAERAERIRGKSVDPSEDNMLKLTHEAKLMAIDPRLINDSLAEDSGMKLKRCCDKVFSIWKDSENMKSTQMIFSDSGTPKPNKFNVYDEIKRQLIEKGIPEDQIVFIHDVKTDKKRADLFEKVRQGEVRVLLGSTSKVGTGTNVQNKLLAVHHIDVPWRPSDLTQRDGRIVRQGNENKEVQIYRYITKNTFDAYLWQIQEQKLKYINQVMTGKSISRSCDDLDETILTAAEAKAVATGNPLISEKMTLDNDITRLRILKSHWQDDVQRNKNNINNVYPKKISKSKKFIDSYEKDIDYLEKNETEFQLLDVDGQPVYEDNFGVYINSRLEALNKEILVTKIGTYKEFEIEATYLPHSDHVNFTYERESRHELVLGNKTGKRAITQFENTLKRMPEKLEEEKKTLAKNEIDLKNTLKEVDQGFSKEDELNEMIRQQKILTLKIEQTVESKGNGKNKSKENEEEVEYGE